MRGIVSKSTGSWYEVRAENNKTISCRIKGKFRLDDLKHTNPIAVGDTVEFEIEDNRETGVINKIEQRKNYIIRKASNLSKQTHIISSNIDQAILVASIVEPITSLGFIDRFLLTTEAYHIQAILIFNKFDLCKGALKNILNDTISLYTKIGYKCFSSSIKNKESINHIKELLKAKTSLFIGHSGVGKSSLLNAVEPKLKLKTSEISNYSSKGKHTTTFAEMFELSFGGFIIDTPGIREFGIVDFSPEEISHYFKEMQPLIGSCKFNNCIHVNEPECAIINAVKSGVISPERYESYLSILNNKNIYN